MAYLLKVWKLLHGPLGDMVKAFIKVVYALVTTELYAIVKEAVALVQADPSLILNEEKRDVAFKIIKELCAAKGIFVRDSIINMLIEARVQVLKVFGGGK